MKQILIISLSFFISCTGARKAGSGNAASKELSAAETIKRIEAGTLEFERLNANLDLGVETDMFNGSVNAKLRMVRDSAIWLSASKLGFEVGRMLITPDSVFVVERLQKTYVRSSIDELSKMAGFELDFELVQDIMIGKPLLHPINNEVIYFDRDSIQIYPDFDDYKITHTVRNGDFKLVKTTLRDESSKTTVSMDLQDYKDLEGSQIFSYFRKIVIDNENAVAITFKNTELNTEKDLKFSIPSSYSPRKF